MTTSLAGQPTLREASIESGRDADALHFLHFPGPGDSKQLRFSGKPNFPARNRDPSPAHVQPAVHCVTDLHTRTHGNHPAETTRFVTLDEPRLL